MKRSRTHHRCSRCVPDGHRCWCSQTHTDTSPHAETAASADRVDTKISQSMFKWTARMKAKQHQLAMAESPDGINHAVLKLKSTVEGREDFGKTMLIGCCCGRVYWRNKFVLDSQVAGDWAKVFRANLGVRTIAPGGRR